MGPLSNEETILDKHTARLRDHLSVHKQIQPAFSFLQEFLTPGVQLVYMLLFSHFCPIFLICTVLLF
jgi:hypothetical protein